MTGAIIGGLAGGKKGAAIGAISGMAVGAARQDRQRREQEARMRQEQERRHWEQQRRLEEQRTREEHARARELERLLLQQQLAAAAPPALAPSHPGTNLVAEIQRSLTVLGYSPGPVDGKMGGATTGAIQAYQQDQGLLTTGQPSEPLLAHMRKAGG